MTRRGGTSDEQKSRCQVSGVRGPKSTTRGRAGVTGRRSALTREEQETEEPVKGYNPRVTPFGCIVKGAMFARRKVSGVRETVRR